MWCCGILIIQNHLLRRIQFKTYNQIFFGSIRIYRMIEKVILWTFDLPKVFLILFPWVATVIAASSVFAYLPGLSNHSQIVYLKSFFTSWSSVFFFTQVRIVISVIDIWVVYRFNFLSTKHWCSIYVIDNTTCFVCWPSVKIKRNSYVFWHNDTISSAMSYFNQYVGSYRKDLVCLPWIYVIPCL